MAGAYVANRIRSPYLRLAFGVFVWRLGIYTLRGHKRDVFEPPEIERHQRLQTVGVGGCKAVDDLIDGGLKLSEARMVAS